MLDSYSASGTSNGPPNLLTKKSLPHIARMLKEEQIPHVPQPHQIGIISSNPSVAPTEPPTTNKRYSRNLLGLFSRNKPNQDDTKSESSAGRNSTSTVTQGHDERSKRTSYLRSERFTKTQPQVETMPFCEALSRTIKHITLAVPTLDADNLLKLAKQREEAQQALQQEIESKKDGDTQNTRQPITDDIPFGWMASIFMLTTDGILYQYPAAGMPDRLPDCFIKLTCESAAFASDAIPGRHWVLQISRCFAQESNPAPGKSRFSRLGLRPVKSVANNMLLIMGNAEEMESWIAAVRNQIKSRGTETTQVKQSPNHEPTGPRLLVKRSTQSMRRTSSTQHLSSKTSEAALIDQLELTARKVSSATRPDFRRSVSDESKLTVTKTPTSNLRHVSLQTTARNTPPESPAIRNASHPALLQWERPADFSPTFSPTAQSFLTNQGRQTSEDLTTRRYRAPSTASDGAPNFSVPTFSNRFSQSTRSGTSVATPPQSSGSSHRAPSPEQPTKDLLGRRGIPALPFIITGSESQEYQRDHRFSPDAFQQDWSDTEEYRIMASNPQAKLPKRLSSLCVLKANHWEDVGGSTEMHPPLIDASRRHSSTNSASSASPATPASATLMLGPNRLSSLGPDSPHNRLIEQSLLVKNCNSPSIIVTPDVSTFPVTADLPSRTSSNPRLNAYEIRRITALGISQSRSFDVVKRNSLSASPTTQSLVAPAIPSPQRSPLTSKFSPAFRPHSLQVNIPSQLKNSTSLHNLAHTPSSKPVSLRQRRSIPAHLHGPPPAPPPNLPLPAIPQPKTATVQG